MDPDVAITMAWVTGSSEEAAQSDLNGTLESVKWSSTSTVARTELRRRS